jgi:murein DD-endopeptidase MepM/ murein hydrolase activator NlpD
VSYPGYPDRSNSPYRLPWEQGNVFRCVQGNLGLWSHTPFSYQYQIYAYDFSHDHGDDVLAMRDGTVWQCDDNSPDGGDLQNTITILHGAAVNGHDFDQNGNSRRTFAVYVHGQQDSIKNAFGLTNAAGDPILPPVGTPVVRGQLIMKADDTGRSAYNHLHIHVEPATVNAAGNVTGMEDYTIPFVFGDEEVERDDGVPKSLHSYESDNVKVP